MIKFFIVCCGLTYWLIGYTESHLAQQQVSSVKQSSHESVQPKAKESSKDNLWPTLKF